MLLRIIPKIGSNLSTLPLLIVGLIDIFLVKQTFLCEFAQLFNFDLLIGLVLQVLFLHISSITMIE